MWHIGHRFATIIMFLFFCLGAGSAGAGDMPRWLDVYSHGGFHIDGNIYGSVVLFDENWKSSIQGSGSISSIARNGGVLSGKFTLNNGKVFELRQVMNSAVGGIGYDVSLKSLSGAVKANQVCLSLSLPLSDFAGKSLVVDGESIILPRDSKDDKVVLSSKRAKNILLPVSQGKLEITGDFNYLLQDNRKYNGNSYSLRLLLNPSSGDITNASLKVNFRIKPVDAVALDLTKAANRSFRDDTAADGKGGWTDQGPDNDLRMIKPGRKTFGGIPFNVIDPQKNNGKSCVVLAGSQGIGFPGEAMIAVGGKKFNYLYFLHSAAWAKTDDVYGKVRVIYEDGSNNVFDVQGKRDVADWWGCFPVSNGAVVWTAENRSNYVGLYMSRFKIENKPVKDIKLESTGKAMWMIVAMSGVNDDIPLPVDDSEVYIIENKDWKPFEHSLNVVKGSALDLSFLADAPAGKYGRVVASGDNFTFSNAPDKTLRLYGSNLCFTANYLEKKECEKLAENFVRYGYNSLRIHHHDQGMIDASAADSLTLDKKQIDKLDYLFYCMKKQGVYITTDIYVSRNLKPAETGVYDRASRRVKALVPASDLVMNNIKAFAKKWLEHVNPYTGIAWKDDPALFAISFVNENTMYSVWQETPEIRTLYDAELLAWVKKENIPYGSKDEKEAALSRFLTNMQIRSYEELRKYVRDVIGCKAVYSDCNMQAYRSQQIARSHYDYVDNHGYWDHPRFPVRNWSLPYGFGNMSILKRYCSLPAGQMPSRIFGKPFAFTEFNYVFPNIYRCEGNPVMGAYAALQGWDAVYRFAFAHRRENAVSVQAANGFDVATDPLSLLGERIVSLLFLRGDVSEAKGSVPYVMTDNIVAVSGSATNATGFSSDYRKLGLIHKTGTVVLDKGGKIPVDSLFCVGLEKLTPQQLAAKPYFIDNDKLLQQLLDAGQVNDGQYNPQTEVIKSDTGEITLDAKKNKLNVCTPSSECVVIPAGESSKGKVLNVENCSTYSTVFVSSLDDSELMDSSRILLLHLTDVKNTQTKYSNSSLTLLEKNGSLPHLVRKGTAQIRLVTAHKNAPQVWALDITGKRLGQMEWKDNGFVADTSGKYGSVMAYEVIWPKK